MTKKRGTFGDAPSPAGRQRRDTIRIDDMVSGPKSLPAAPPLKDLDPLNVRGLLLAERYRVEKFVGSGGLGYVYAGVDLRFQRPGEHTASVAIKFMKHRRPDLMKDFHREAQLMKQFGQSHHAFVEVYDYGVSKEGLPWLVMEFLPDAVSINDLMARYEDRVPTDIVVQFLREVCPALSLAHSRNLVHRDLSASNIMLSQAGDPRGRTFKILDFGLSTQLNATDELANQTITSSPYGTPTHMAPEQVTSQHSTPRTDVYSIGVTLFLLLTGKLPLPRTANQFEALDHCRHTVPFSFREVAPDRKYPAEVERVVQQCLCKRPADRPQDLQQVAEQLLAALTRTETRPPTSHWLGWMAATSICVVAVALVVSLFLPPRDGGGGAIIVNPVPIPAEPKLKLERDEMIVSTGGETSVAITVENLSADSEIEVGADAESGLMAEFVPGANWPNEAVGKVVVRADPKTSPREHQITLTATTGKNSESRSEPLFAKVQVVWLPQDYRSTANAERDDDSVDRYGFRHITRQFGDERVDFLLVPRPLKGDDPSSFYMMKFKVWRGLYKEYLKSPLGATSTEGEAVLQEWAKDSAGTDRWPATGLSPLEADRVAKWLGGSLPTQAEWDRAAGYEFTTAGFNGKLPSRWNSGIWTEGPFITSAQGIPDIALRQYQDVGAAADDITWCGCRDMAGNGYEFLDNLQSSGVRLSRTDTLPAAGSLLDGIKMRGKPINSAEHAKPLLYRDMGVGKFGSFTPIHQRASHCGFRVVIER